MMATGNNRANAPELTGYAYISSLVSFLLLMSLFCYLMSILLICVNYRIIQNIKVFTTQSFKLKQRRNKRPLKFQSDSIINK
jgi:hypothetical protein